MEARDKAALARHPFWLGRVQMRLRFSKQAPSRDGPSAPGTHKYTLQRSQLSPSHNAHNFATTRVATCISLLKRSARALILAGWILDSAPHECSILSTPRLGRMGAKVHATLQRSPRCWFIIIGTLLEHMLCRRDARGVRRHACVCVRDVMRDAHSCFLSGPVLVYRLLWCAEAFTPAALVVCGPCSVGS